MQIGPGALVSWNCQEAKLVGTTIDIDAQKFRDDLPRTSRMLNRMADQYEQYARSQDTDADLTQDLWR